MTDSPFDLYHIVQVSCDVCCQAFGGKCAASLCWCLFTVRQRDEWEKKRRMKVKRERGWTGNSWGGISLGTPDPGPNGGKTHTHSHSVGIVLTRSTQYIYIYVVMETNLKP